MTRQVPPAFARASNRAHEIIELMLQMMLQGLQEPELQEQAQWNRLFGDKQSTAASLQKLVQALAVLPVEGGAKANAAALAEVEPELSAEEMEMLAAWLAQTGE